MSSVDLQVGPVAQLAGLALFGDATSLTLYESRETTTDGPRGKISRLWRQAPSYFSWRLDPAITGPGATSDKGLALMQIDLSITSGIDITPLRKLEARRLNPSTRKILEWLIDWFSQPDQMGQEWWDSFEAETRRQRLRLREFES